jgi:hypothetical protein
MKSDSLDDLNFMENRWPSSGPFVKSAVELSAVDRTGFSHHPEPKATSTNVTSAYANQRPTGPVSKGQRPEVRVQKASVKRASTVQAARQSACS